MTKERHKDLSRGFSEREMRNALWEKVGRFSPFFSDLLTRLSNKRGVLDASSAHFLTIFTHSFPEFSPEGVKKA
jgi:hypothetical protein